MTLGTPALLFGAISLLLLAYTNRFGVLARLVRDLHAQGHGPGREVARKQLPSLRRRVALIKYMQSFAVLSFLSCTLSMLCLFLEKASAGNFLFGLSVILLMISLAMSLLEVISSTKALDIVLDDFDARMSPKDVDP